MTLPANWGRLVNPSTTVHIPPAEVPGVQHITAEWLYQFVIDLIEGILKQAVLALTGVFDPLLTAFEQLTSWANDIPIVGDLLKLIESILGDIPDNLLDGITKLGDFFSGLDAKDGDLLTQIVAKIVEQFTGFPGQGLAELKEFADNIPVVGDLVGAVTGILDGTGTLDDLANWAKKVPEIPSLVAALTGVKGQDLAPLDLTTLQTWAQDLLTVKTPVPADNLFGVLPPAAIPSIPVAHINTTAPNLLRQGSFNTPGTISAADGWSWDDSQNRTQGGGGSARVECNGTVRRLYSSQAIPVGLGDQIEASCAIKVSGFSGAQGSVNLAIIPFIGSQPQQTIIAGQASTANLSAAASDWVQIGTSSPIFIGAGVTSIKMRLGVTAAATAGTVWFDSIQCSKAGLLPQGLVTDLPNAWNEIYKGAQGLDPFATVTKGWDDLYNALSNPTSIAQVVTNNLNLLYDSLSTDPGQVLGTKPVDGGLPFGLGNALADGKLTLNEAWDVVGQAAVGLYNFVIPPSSPLRGFTDSLLDLFGISTTAKNNSVTNADNIQETAKAVYRGYFGTGTNPNGTIAEVQETISTIKARITGGYTLQSLTYNADMTKQLIQIIGSPTGGTFTLTYGGQTTSAIAYNATASTIQTALRALSGIGNSVTVTDVPSGYPYIASTARGFFATFSGFTTPAPTAITPVFSLTGGTSPGVYTAGVWTPPWATVNDAPRELYLVAFGSGQGGGCGAKVESNVYQTVSGGNGGNPGGYAALEIDATSLNPLYPVPYQIPAGGLGSTTVGADGNVGGESYFFLNPALSTKAGEYYVSNVLGYYTTNQSAPGKGGLGGQGYVVDGGGLYYAGWNGYPGGTTLLANGGSGGSGGAADIRLGGAVQGPGIGGGTVNVTYAGTINGVPTNGSLGATASLTGKSRAGGGGGGGGGGSYSYYSEVLGTVFNQPAAGPGGLGGNGGFPGGGGGGGGGSFRWNNGGFTGIPGFPNPGNGGNGANGVIILLWK